jgi:hypothetical protein
MKDGVLTFPKVNEKPDGFYRTRTKGILHNGVVYARSNHNLQVGVQRLCKSRGGSLEAHLRLLGNQERFLDTAYVRELEKRVLQRRIPVFEDLVNALQYMHEHYDDPHPSYLHGTLPITTSWSTAALASASIPTGTDV